MKIIFMGTPDFAVPALKALHNSTHEILCVYSAAPKPARRGMNLMKSKIHQVADELGLNVLTPLSLKSTDAQIQFKNFSADVAVVVAYGLLLPKEILEGTKFGCINIHPSLLPRWRGAAPIQRAVMSGDSETGCCIMQMNEGLDTGDIILQKNIPLPQNATSGIMHDILAGIGTELLLEALDKIENGTVAPTKQSEAGVTYAKKLIAEEEKLDFTQNVIELHNKIRGLSPYPASYFMLDGMKYKVFEAEFRQTAHSEQLGKITNEKFEIACNSGFITPLLIQKEGKKLTSIKDFINGNKGLTGKIINESVI